MGRLSERLEALRVILLLQRIVPFGSWAREISTVVSDIDLLVVYQGATRENAFAIVKRALNIPALEPRAYSEEEYRQLEGQILRMTGGGIVPFLQ